MMKEIRLATAQHPPRLIARRRVWVLALCYAGLLSGIASRVIAQELPRVFRVHTAFLALRDANRGNSAWDRWSREVDLCELEAQMAACSPLRVDRVRFARNRRLR